MTHRNLVDRAVAAIGDVFSDTSVGPETTLGDLNELIEEIEMRMEAIKSDMG